MIRHRLVSLALPVLLSLCVWTATARATPEVPVTRSGTLSLATEYRFASSALGDKRTIVVSVPAGYAASKARYPVIYLLDGMQNIRHAAGTRDVLVRSGDMPPVILVGLESVDRSLDMTPSRMRDNPRSGGASKLLAHLRDEVIPYVDAHYRTNGFRVLAGHSFGGLFCAWAWMQDPKLFQAQIIMSPAFWWNHEQMRKAVGPFLAAHPKLDTSVYFGIGADDGLGMRQELKRFVDTVKANQPKGMRVGYREFDGEGHMSAPLRTFYRGVKFVFADLRLPDPVIHHFTTRAFLAHERMIRDKYGASARQTQDLYVPLGLHLLKIGNVDGAIAVLRRNAQAYAGNRYPQNHAWLASAYEAAGRKADALAEYRRAYRLALGTGYGTADAYRRKILALGGHVD